MMIAKNGNLSPPDIERIKAVIRMKNVNKQRISIIVF